MVDSAACNYNGFPIRTSSRSSESGSLFPPEWELFYEEEDERAAGSWAAFFLWGRASVC